MVEAALESPRALSMSQIAEITALPDLVVRETLESGIREGWAVDVGNTYVGRQLWTRMSDRARAALAQFHSGNPLKRGMTREELRSKLHCSRIEWDGWLTALLERRVVEESDSFIAMPGFVSKGEERRADAERVLATLSASELTPPSGRELLERAGADSRLLAFMAESGEIVHVGGGIYFTAAAVEKLMALALEIIDREGEVSMARFRDASGTSRKYAQAVLEYFDARRITRRAGDVRVRGREAPACA
jgi:selenocysteine-specific elongation factor